MKQYVCFVLFCFFPSNSLQKTLSLFCAQTDIHAVLIMLIFQDLDSGNSMFVQSLRSDPFRVSL